MLLSLLLTITLFQDQNQIDETIAVTRKQLRVRVADRKGKPVTGMTADQFVLKVNGKTVSFSLRESELEARKVASLEAVSNGVSASPIALAKSSTETVDIAQPAFRNAVILVLDTNMQPMQSMSKFKEAVLPPLEYWINTLTAEISITSDELKAAQTAFNTATKRAYVIDPVLDALLSVDLDSNTISV